MVHNQDVVVIHDGEGDSRAGRGSIHGVTFTFHGSALTVTGKPESLAGQHSEEWTNLIMMKSI
jgi:hypothetical protein